MTTKTQVGRGVDLDALIPEEWRASEYIPRYFNGVRDIDILDRARTMKPKKANVLMYGPTGPGKTTAVEAYCAEKRLPFYSFPCNGSVETKQIVGARVPDENGKYPWVDGIITSMARQGRGVVLLDEVNFLHPRISAYFHSLLDRRRTLTLLDNSGEVIRAGDDFQIVAAFNPDYEGTRPLNEAFKNRFAIKLHYKYDPTIEAQLVSLESLGTVAAKLRASYGTSVETPVSTNMLMEFEDLAFEFGIDFALENFTAAFAEEEKAAVKEVLKLSEAQLRDEWERYMSGEEEGDDSE